MEVVNIIKNAYKCVVCMCSRVYPTPQMRFDKMVMCLKKYGNPRFNPNPHLFNEMRELLNKHGDQINPNCVFDRPDEVNGGTVTHTPLTFAIACDQPELCATLLQNGANANFIQLSFDVASRVIRQDDGIIYTMLKIYGANLTDFPQDQLNLLLLYAVMTCDTERIMLYIDAGADVNACYCDDTPLSSLLQCGYHSHDQIETVYKLLQRYDVDLNTPKHLPELISKHFM